jgi:hypothetical protein
MRLLCPLKDARSTRSIAFMIAGIAVLPRLSGAWHSRRGVCTSTRTGYRKPLPFVLKGQALKRNYTPIKPNRAFTISSGIMDLDCVRAVTDLISKSLNYIISRSLIFCNRVQVMVFLALKSAVLMEASPKSEKAKVGNESAMRSFRI